jgi:hypothetical protein
LPFPWGKAEKGDYYPVKLRLISAANWAERLFK